MTNLKQYHLVNNLTLTKPGKKLRNGKSIQVQLKFQSQNYQLTLTGETLVELILLHNIEIRDIVGLAILFHLLKL